jgi:hypothetical protein
MLKIYQDDNCTKLKDPELYISEINKHDEGHYVENFLG